MRREDLDPAGSRRILFGGLLIALTLLALERAFSMVFVLNFSTAGPNASIAFVLLLLSGLLLTTRIDPTWFCGRDGADAAVAAIAFLTLLTFLPAPVLAALAALLTLAAATPLLLTLTEQLGSRTAIAVALGLAIHQALRAILGSQSLHADSLGVILVLVLVGGLASFWILEVRTSWPSPAPRSTVVRHGALFAFLVFEYAFLNSSTAVALWHGHEPTPIAVSNTLGLLTGVLLIQAGIATRRPAPSFALLLFLGAVTDLLWLDLAPALTVFLAQTAGLVLLHVGLHAQRVQSWRRAGLGLAGVQFLTLLLVVSLVAAANWAFVPLLGPLLHGRANLLLFLLAFLPAALAWTNWNRRTEARPA